MTKSELKKHFEWTLEIINVAKQYVFDSRSILLLDSAEKDIVIRRNKFMSRTQEALWNLAIIETHKLFGGKNDDFRLQKLINYLKESYRNSEWKNDITLSDIHDLEIKLNDSEVISKIKLLRELRSQHYAHKQKSSRRHESDINLYYEGVNFLLEVAVEICATINNQIFNNSALNYHIDETSINTTIGNLVEFVRLKGQESLGKNKT